jgi:hypothetical protein
MMSVRRVKSYTGQTGYVYQYYFVGKRPALSGATAGAATEYVFDVSADRATYFAISIFVEQDGLRAWAEQHGRELTDAEQYAAAKMSLFSAFDEVESLKESTRQFTIGPENIASVLEMLDLG